MPSKKPAAKKKKPVAADADKLLFGALVVILAIIVVFFVYSLSIGRAPQAYTQLWLSGNNPQTAIAGKNFSSGFVIENGEGKTVEYEYSFTAENKVAASGKISLESGKQKPVNAQFSFSKAYAEKQKVLIEVRKPGRSEPYTLWFWLTVGD
ncbi:MAG: hypothetical protein WC602_03605 [archaeon]